MKKYKIHWSFFNLLNDSQAEVVKLQMIFKVLMSGGAVTAWAETTATWGMIVGGIGIVVDLLIGCFYFEEIGKH